MDELFTMLSSSARLDKSSRKKKKKNDHEGSNNQRKDVEDDDHGEDDQHEEEHDDDDDCDDNDSHNETPKQHTIASRDRTGKRDMSDKKRKQVHAEQMAAFRRSMSIRVANKSDPDLPDAISSFDEIKAPSWWRNHVENNEQGDISSFVSIAKAIQRNVEAGRWKEPTPIQMQSIPTLLERRDLVAGAPTGIGKSWRLYYPRSSFEWCTLSRILQNKYYDTY